MTEVRQELPDLNDERLILLSLDLASLSASKLKSPLHFKVPNRWKQVSDKKR